MSNIFPTADELMSRLNAKKKAEEEAKEKAVLDYMAKIKDEVIAAAEAGKNVYEGSLTSNVSGTRLKKQIESLNVAEDGTQADNIFTFVQKGDFNFTLTWGPAKNK